MRLEVTLSGEFYRVCAQKLTRDLTQRVRDAFGDQWRQALNRLAVGPARKETLAEVAEKTGQVPPVEYQRTGVLLGSRTLGLTIRLGGTEVFADQLDQAVRHVLPSKLMERYADDDVLGVFATTGGGFLRCVFDDVKNFDGSLLSLTCDEAQKLMNRQEPFELVHAMTYDGAAPRKSECVPAAQMEHVKQVFHAKRH